MARTFVFSSTFNANAGEAVIYVKNCRKDTPFTIRKVTVGAGAATRFHIGTAQGEASGTEITGQNLSRISLRKTPNGDCESYGDNPVTGITPGNTVPVRPRVQPNVTIVTVFDDDTFQLGEGQAIAVWSDGDGAVDVSIEGSFG